MLESKIQQAIVKWLQSAGFYFFSVPNELGGKDAAIRTARYKSLGLRSGAPDLCVLLPEGKIIFLEIKNERGRQSDAQKNFQERAESLGYKYFITRSVEDVQKIIL